MTKHRQSFTEVIEEAVTRGATAVEEIHKGIADLPLKLLEATVRFRKPARRVRRAQDRAIGSIYDAVRDANHRVAKLVSDLVDRASRPATPAGRAAA